MAVVTRVAELSACCVTSLIASFLVMGVLVGLVALVYTLVA